MHRRAVCVVTAVVLAAATVAATDASAKAKPKIKTMKGSYTLTLLPDPTMEATGAAGKECFNVNPESVDTHTITLPGSGTLHVVLDSPNVQGKTDWDLYILDAGGNVIDSSHGPTSHEETVDTLRKGKIGIKSCNLLGEPTATVTYTYTYH